MAGLEDPRIPNSAMQAIFMITLDIALIERDGTAALERTLVVVRELAIT
jgi:hypothetical protein